jgi:hypothetical protein
MTIFTSTIGTRLDDGSTWDAAGNLIGFPTTLGGATLTFREVRALYARLDELAARPVLTVSTPRDTMEPDDATTEEGDMGGKRGGVREGAGRKPVAVGLGGQPEASVVFPVNLGPTLKDWYKGLGREAQAQVRKSLIALLVSNAQAPRPAMAEPVKGGQLQIRVPASVRAAYDDRGEDEKQGNRNALLAWLLAASGQQVQPAEAVEA